MWFRIHLTTMRIIHLTGIHLTRTRIMSLIRRRSDNKSGMFSFFFLIYSS